MQYTEYSTQKKACKTCGASGILKTRYTSVDLVSIQQVRFPALEEVDPETLSETTVIQASKENGRWTVAPSGSVCSCKGSCITNRCRCKKAQLKCSTKCHTSVVGLCQNKLRTLIYCSSNLSRCILTSVNKLIEM